MKKLISLIIIVTFTVTTLTTDSLALRPAAYRSAVSGADSPSSGPEKIYSVFNETSAVLSDIYGKVLAEKPKAATDDISKDFIDFFIQHFLFGGIEHF